MNNEPTPESLYAQKFMGHSDDKTKRAKALAFAVETRKFEIELYWKRATYFWAFTGAAFAAYLTVLTSKEVIDRPAALLLVSCLGFVFSVAWFFVNRASKFWQSNWEAHVDKLEDDVMGPIYKTVLSDELKFWKPAHAYRFSVSKINQLLSLFVVLIFLVLVADTLITNYHPFWRVRSINLLASGCVTATVIAISLFLWLGRTGSSYRKVTRDRRATGIVPPN